MVQTALATPWPMYNTAYRRWPSPSLMRVTFYMIRTRRKMFDHSSRRRRQPVSAIQSDGTRLKRGTLQTLPSPSSQ